MASTNELEELKARQQKIWSSGDYARIAWLTVPVAEALCEGVDLRAGRSVLDVATGTGNVALATARRFCPTTGVDYVPELLATARSRATAEQLEIDFRTEDAENLGFPDNQFDYVLSAIGVMFTADHQRAAAELVRVCKPGGRIGLANWTAAGFVGEILKTVGRHAPPPPGAQPATRWADEDTLRALLGHQVSDLRFDYATITQRFLSPEHFADFFLTHYGPTFAAAQRLDAEQRESFRADLVALAAASNRARDGTLVNDWAYQIAVATKR